MSQAKPSQAKPSQAKPSQAKPSQAKPSQAHACIPYDLFQVTAPVNKQNRDEKSPCHTLAKDNCAHAAVVVGCIPINADADRGNSAAITPSPDAEGRIRLRDPGIGIGVDGDPMFTMQSTKPHAVAIDLQNVAIGGDIAETLDTTRPSRGGWQAVAFKPGQSEAAGGTFVTEEFAPTVQSQNNGSTAVPAVAFKPSHYTRGKDGSPSEIVAPLSADADKGDQDTIVAFSPLQGGRSMPVTPESPTLEAGTGNKTPAIAFTQNTRDEVRQINGDGSVAGALSAESGSHQTNYVAIDDAEAFQTRIARCGRGSPEPIAPALNGSDAGATSDMRPCIRQAMQVRRLTPTECEALQGFPIGYTDVPYRNKPAADGPRYRALGNSMAVPCMWWLGSRMHKATS